MYICRGRLVTALLYADDAVLFADDEGMRVSLEVLYGWCKEWSVEVNMEKCGFMHMRRGVKRTGEKFYVDNLGV